MSQGDNNLCGGHQSDGRRPPQACPTEVNRAHWTVWPFMALIWGYRFTLAPLMAGHCRFLPTCSAYGLEAYRVHGPVRGSSNAGFQRAGVV